ncbi:MAG: ParB/RepB/Spo0J family partition protein [Isosphaeraceae bacterium]
MKNADELRNRLGGNMARSMGDISHGAGGLPAGFAAPSGQYAGCTRIKDALAIEIARISPDPNQPRKDFDEAALDELAASLKARGQLQPIRVRWDEPSQKWIIIAGERRYRAAVRAGLPTLACVEARGNQNADDILEDQLVENCVREDLKPLEQAQAYRTLMERRGWSYRELGEFLHISKAKIAKAMALLDLPDAVQELVEQGGLAPNTAYEVSRLERPIDQVEVARQVVAENLTAEETASVVKSRKLGIRNAPDGQRPRPFQVEVRPGIIVSVKGVATEAEAVEACKAAATILRRRGRDQAA